VCRERRVQRIQCRHQVKRSQTLQRAHASVDAQSFCIDTDVVTRSFARQLPEYGEAGLLALVESLFVPDLTFTD